MARPRPEATMSDRTASGDEANLRPMEDSDRTGGPQRPIFIAGCPRSGTTLLAAMLGAHPACLATPESQFKTELRDGDGDLAGLAEALRRHWRFRVWDVELAADPAPRDARDATLAAVRSYALRHDRSDAYRWVDHTPSNLRHARTLLGWFPEARFIHLVRDVRATAASVMPLPWGPNSALKAAAWWQGHISTNVAAETWLGADRVTRVGFEDVLRDPESELRRLLAFLDLPWDERVLHARGFQPPAYTRAQHRLVGKPLDGDRVDEWRSRLSRREVEVVEAVAGATMQLLGYDLACEPGRRLGRGDLLRAFATEARRRIGNGMWIRRRRRSIGR